MTKTELFTAMREHGYTDPAFYDDLEADEATTGTLQYLIRLIESGQTEIAWTEIERLHDEFVYFNMNDDDILVFMVNEAWMQ